MSDDAIDGATGGMNDLPSDGTSDANRVPFTPGIVGTGGKRRGAGRTPGLGPDGPSDAGAAADAGRFADTLGLVPVRRLVEDPVEVRFRLSPGDRTLVSAGQTVVAGAPILERIRDPRLTESAAPTPGPLEPGAVTDAGELLFAWRGRWRAATGDLAEPVETPVAGIVKSVQPGSAVTIRTASRAVRGIVALGGATRGRLQTATGRDGELRSGGLDVGFAGTILVVGSRIDAETLTRARAMGVRGVIVGGLASKERRDFAASEARQRAALHRLPPFAVLVLDGALRRQIPGPIQAILDRLIGREVAITTDPPMLVFDPPEAPLPVPPPDHVRIRGGEHAGREGRWAGLLGRRRFPGGVQLEAAAVRLADDAVIAVPLGDLERFG